MLAPSEIAAFQSNLRAWFSVHQRDLPWRKTQEPYPVWISEIMLQQTRAGAAIPYFERFLKRFPTVETLAEAAESDLLAHWAGLGYYFRARHLQKAARIVVAAGSFPDTHQQIRALPGVGDYTAAAIASISFGLPHAVVDGNVFRVLSRIFADPTDIGSSVARKHFTALAQQLLDHDRPGMFNQAMMELGATICLPKNPQCLLCPVSGYCQALAVGRQNKFPVKILAKRNATEQRTVFWIERNGNLLLWQRPAGSRLMPGFWELPEPAQLPGIAAGREFGSFRHAITVHNYVFDVFEAVAEHETGPCHWVALRDLTAVPVSTIVRKAQRVVRKVRGKQDVRAVAGGV